MNALKDNRKSTIKYIYMFEKGYNIVNSGCCLVRMVQYRGGKDDDRNNQAEQRRKRRIEKRRRREERRREERGGEKQAKNVR